jgi:predicted nucleic acid-binding protein
MAKIVLTDTCFWLGLIEPKDQFHVISNSIAELIEGYQIIFPWPCLYETICTHLSRRRDRLLYLEEFIRRPDIVLLDDENYKESALEEVFKLNRTAGFTYSLVDSVIREVLKDVNVKINYLVTFNERDFIDICQIRQIGIINN